MNSHVGEIAIFWIRQDKAGEFDTKVVLEAF